MSDNSPQPAAVEPQGVSPLEAAEAALTEALHERLAAPDLDHQFDPEEDVFAVAEDDDDDDDDGPDAYRDPDDRADLDEYEDPHLTVQTAISIRLANIDGHLARIAASLEALAEFTPSLVFAVSGVSDSVEHFGTSLLADALTAKPRPATPPAPRPAAPARPPADDLPRPNSINAWLDRATMPGDMGNPAILKRYDNITVWWATVEYFGITREVAIRVLETQHIAQSLAGNQYVSARLWAIALTALNVEVPPPHRNWAEVLEARRQRLAQNVETDK